MASMSSLITQHICKVSFLVMNKSVQACAKFKDCSESVGVLAVLSHTLIRSTFLSDSIKGSSSCKSGTKTENILNTGNLSAHFKCLTPIYWSSSNMTSYPPPQQWTLYILVLFCFFDSGTLVTSFVFACRMQIFLSHNVHILIPTLLRGANIFGVAGKTQNKIKSSNYLGNNFFFL